MSRSLVALCTVLLCVACRHGASTSSQSSNQRATSKPLPPPEYAAGCASLPNDHDLLYRRGVDLVDPYMKLSDRGVGQSRDRDTSPFKVMRM